MSSRPADPWLKRRLALPRPAASSSGSASSPIERLVAQLAPEALAPDRGLGLPGRWRGRARGRLHDLVNRGAAGRPKRMTQPYRPGHLAKVPLAKAGLAVGLVDDLCREALLMIDVGQLERGGGYAHRCDQGDCRGPGIADDAHDRLCRNEIVEHRLGVEQKLDGRFRGRACHREMIELPGRFLAAGTDRKDAGREKVRWLEPSDALASDTVSELLQSIELGALR